MKKFILIALLGIIITAHGQVGITNSGNLQIHTGISITVFADFTNNSTATLTNNGNLYLKNNISNSQSGMTFGTGTLYLN